MVFDGAGRLVLVDHVEPNISPEQDRPPSGLEQFRDEDYRGPLVFRISLDPTLALPRRLDRTPPLFPRAWGARAGGALLPRPVELAPRRHAPIVLSPGGHTYLLPEHAP